MKTLFFTFLILGSFSLKAQSEKNTCEKNASKFQKTEDDQKRFEKTTMLEACLRTYESEKSQEIMRLAVRRLDGEDIQSVKELELIEEYEDKYVRKFTKEEIADFGEPFIAWKLTYRSGNVVKEGWVSEPDDVCKAKGFNEAVDKTARLHPKEINPDNSPDLIGIITDKSGNEILKKQFNYEGHQLGDHYQVYDEIICTKDREESDDLDLAISLEEFMSLSSDPEGLDHINNSNRNPENFRKYQYNSNDAGNSDDTINR